VNRAFTLNELAALFAATVFGDGQYCVLRAADADGAIPGSLAFVETVDQLKACAGAGAAVLASPELALECGPDISANGLTCADARLHFHVANRLLTAHDDLGADELAGDDPADDGGRVWISPKAVVHGSAKLAPGCVVQAGASIEAHAALFPGVVVERGAFVGAGSIIRSRAVIGRDAVVGPLCEIGSGSVIGAEPQQFEAADGVWTRKPGQTRVRLGSRVAVGANSVIESGARRETVIESDVLIGGQVYIAHDCRINRGVLIIGQSGLASGVHIDDGAALMGCVAVGVDVHIGAGALVLATSGVTKDVAPGARVWGNPARSRNEALRKLHRRSAPNAE
jgi:UDP-3-O-[3-hydroxymyristoyl] glucosamine N-acyltransferase LpxD